MKQNSKKKKLKKFLTHKGHLRDSNINKMVVKLREEFANSKLAVEGESDKLSNELGILLSEVEQLKEKIKGYSSQSEANMSVSLELINKGNRAQELIEKQKLLWTKIPLDNRDWSFIEQQGKLNLLLDRVKIESGDALIDVNVVIEGCLACGESETYSPKQESYFVSLLQLLEACVLHQRIWLSGGSIDDTLQLHPYFHFGDLGPILQSEGILQEYSGISNLTDIEAVKKRVKFYSTLCEKKKIDEFLLRDISISETARMKYIPHSDQETAFKKFIETIKENIYVPLIDSVYEGMAESLENQFNEIQNYIRTEEVFIPPIAAIILSRASKFNEIPEVTLETRKRFSKIRMVLMEYEDILSDTNVSLKKRLKILSDVNLINKELSKPYEYLDSLGISEWPDTWDLVSSLFESGFSMTKFTGKLLGKPLIGALKNLRLRNVSYLFNLRRKIYTTNSHNNLVRKYLPKGDIEKVIYYLNPQ